MSSPNLQLVGGAYQDSEGNVLNAGYLLLQLSHDENYASGPAQIVGGVHFEVSLNSSGSIPTSPAVMVYSNDVLTPSGSYYIVRAFKSDGTEAWASPQYWTLSSSPNPLDVGTIVPTNPPGSGLSGLGASTLLLETNGTVNTNQALLNLANGTNVTITNSAGTTMINATGGASFATSGQGWFAGPGVTDQMIIHNTAVTKPMNDVASNKLSVINFNLMGSFTLSSVTYQFTSGGTGGETVNFGIYSYAGNKLIDSGTFNGNSTSLQSNTFTPVTLPPGSYFFAVSDTVGSEGVNGPGCQVLADVSQLLAMFNSGAVPLIAVAANSTAAGVMPATLGTLTALTIANFIGFPIPLWRV